MESNETIYTKKDVIENYKPMFTEKKDGCSCREFIWSLWR